MHASWIVSIALVLALAAEGPPAKRMADGKVWTTANVAVDVAPSWCYDDTEANCRAYGRLYTWASARQACAALGTSWRLPTNDEWKALATRYGGLLQESPEAGKAAFAALVHGGPSGFDAVLGGGRAMDGGYARADAHGFYWTETETGADTAWFYNFGRGMQALNRHADGEKTRAFAVRCIRD